MQAWKDLPTRKEVRMLESHYNYLSRLVKGLHKLAASDPFAADRILQLLEIILLLSELDLEPARPILQACYSNHAGGKKPKDPVCMFRCMILMAACGFTSYKAWAEHLKGHPELILLAGFEPDAKPHTPLAPPAKATFYDFQHRLLDGKYRRACEHYSPPSQRFKGTRERFSRNLKKEKKLRKLSEQKQLDADGEKKVQQRCRIALDTMRQKLPRDFLNILEELLMHCAVIPSAFKGILGDLSQLDLCGDASLLASQASSSGRPSCQCKKQGEAKCECPRIYSDPEATWGWDSYKKTWVFGYKLHVMSTIVDGRDLPLHLSIEPAHYHDCVMGVEATSRFYKLLKKYLPESGWRYLIFDKGYDALYFYKLLMQLDAIPIIPLSKTVLTPQTSDGIELDEQGVPLCPGKAPMRLHCYNKKTFSQTFNCPAKRPGRTNGKAVFKLRMERCPLNCLCEPHSIMGPIVHLSCAENPRLNPPLPRSSASFKKAYKKRTSSERFFSLVTEHGKLGHRPYRRKHFFALGALVRAIGSHARVWVKKRYQDTSGWKLSELFTALDARLQELGDTALNAA